VTAGLTTPRAILVSDLDVTLRRHGEDLGPGVAMAIATLIEQGVMFVPASGKGVDYLYDLFSRHGVRCDMVCGENGGHIRHRLDGSWDEIHFGDQSALRTARAHLEQCSMCNSWREEERKVTILTMRFEDHDQAVSKAQRWRACLGRIFGQRPIEVYTYADDDAVDLVIEPGQVSKVNVLNVLRTRFSGVPLVVAGDGNNDECILQDQRVLPVCPANASVRAAHPVCANEDGYVSTLDYSAGTLDALRHVMGPMGFRF
jgi:hypothetical protein